MEEKLEYNNGIWLSRSGKAYEDEAGTKEIKLVPYNGYYIVPNEYLEKKDKLNPGQFIHRMIVYRFGDCFGKPYVKGMEVDHLDMDHSHNNVENLEVVPKVVNLARAVASIPSKDCIDRLVKFIKDISQQDALAGAIQLAIIEKDLGVDIRKYLDVAYIYGEVESFDEEPGVPKEEGENLDSTK